MILNNYFNLGTDIIVENKPNLDKEVYLDWKYYFVKNIPLKGDSGGLLLFIPSFHILRALIFSIFLVLIFIFLEMMIRKRFFVNISRKNILFNLSLFGSILFLISFAASLYKLDKEAINLKKLPYLIYNAVMKLDPEADIVNRFFENGIKIKK